MSKKKSIIDIDIILLGILGFNIACLFIFWEKVGKEYFLYANGCSLLIILFIILPLNERITKREGRSKKQVIYFLFEISIIMSFLYSLYQIVISQNYHLKYTYLIFLLGFIYITVIMNIKSLRVEFKNRSNEGLGLLRLGLRLLLLITTFCIPVITFVNYYVYSKNEIYIPEIKNPVAIEVYEPYHNIEQIFMREPINSIVDEKEIEVIREEISNNYYKNIVLTDVFNYERMLKKSKKYYILEFKYNELHENNSYVDRKLENGYIQHIIVSSNGVIALERNRSKKLFIGYKMYKEIYPLTLSENTENILLQYIE